MLKEGVLGAGHLGRIHLKLLQQSEKYELVGFYDPDIANGQRVAEEFKYRYFDQLDALMDAVDVVDIVTPTLSHYNCAIKAITKGKHIFIEKPITNTIEEAEHIRLLVSENNLRGQVGHVERFNPAFKAIKSEIKNPMFIETHRLAEFNPRGTDVPVVLDLMIHDIDIILSVVKSPVLSVHASGVSVISETPDIANARIEFENGCVANLTASRISLKNMRKSRFFQKEAYIAVDFLEKKSEIVKISDFHGTDNYAMLIENAEGDKKQIYYNSPEAKSVNAIEEEHIDFANSILHNKIPQVSFNDGLRALKLAKLIIDKVNENS